MNSLTDIIFAINCIIFGSITTETILFFTHSLEKFVICKIIICIGILTLISICLTIFNYYLVKKRLKKNRINLNKSIEQWRCDVIKTNELIDRYQNIKKEDI